MRKELIQVENILNSLQKANAVFQQSSNVDSHMICEVLNAVEEINFNLFGAENSWRILLMHVKAIP